MARSAATARKPKQKKKGEQQQKKTIEKKEKTDEQKQKQEKRKMKKKNKKKQSADGSEPSTSAASEETEKKPRKRVSFPTAGNIVREKSPKTSPKEKELKSILKRRNSSDDAGNEGVKKKKKREEKMEKNDEKQVEQEELPEMEGLVEEEKNKKKKFKLQVTRKEKEDLKLMSHKERKDAIKKLRAKKRPYYELATQCKRLWEVIRSGKSTEVQKEKSITSLCSLVEGKVSKLIYAHDTVRVIQCLMSLDKPAIRSSLFEQLRGEVVRMAKSKYAQFFVRKMFLYGTPEQRGLMFASFRGKIVSLYRHQEASNVIEYAYNQFANKKQRAEIVREFYGPKYAMFEDQEIVSIEEIFEKEPAKRASVLENIRETLEIVVHKMSLRHSLSHRLLFEYMSFCTEEQRSEMVEIIRDRFTEIAHTRDGSRVAMYCVWLSDTKQRKELLKQLRDHVLPTAKSDHAHMLLLAIFDSIDDTVLVKKNIIKPIADHIGEVMQNKNGFRVVDYLVRPRDPRYFQKDLVNVLAKGDTNPFSKKEKDKRYEELWGGICGPLTQYVAANMRELIFDKQKAVFVLNLLQTREGQDSRLSTEERSECYSAVVELAKEEFIPCNLEEQLHLVEHANSHFVITKLLLCDAHLHKIQQPTLTAVLIKELSKKQLIEWTACNKGCFVLLRMFESGVCRDEMRALLEAGVSRLKNSGTNAAKLLLDKVGD